MSASPTHPRARTGARRALIALASLALAAPMLTAATAQAAPTSRPATAAPSSAVSRGAGPLQRAPQRRAGATVHTLVTGERVSVSADLSRVAVLPTAGRRSGTQAITTYRLGRRLLVVPGVARPAIGRALAPELFDLNVQPGAMRTGRYPLLIRHTGGRPQVPGVTVTSDAHGLAQGYLTPAGARSFGAALAASYAATRGRPLLSPFPGVTRIAPAVVPATVRPAYPMKTFVIRVRDTQGKPVTALGSLVNLDDASRYNAFVAAWDGEARVSVPVGHYALDLTTVKDAPDHKTDLRFLVREDLSVTRSGQVVTLQESEATSRFDATTPRSAPYHVGTVAVNRTDALQAGGTAATTSFPPSFRVWFTPTQGAAVGDTFYVFGLTAYPNDPLSPAEVVDEPYEYDLAWTYDHIPDDLTYDVTSRDVEEMAASYDADTSQRTGSVSYSPMVDVLWFYLLVPMRAPTTRTHYVGGSSSLPWSAETTSNLGAGDWSYLSSASRPALQGRRTSTVWRRGPQAPTVPVQTMTDRSAFCRACRTATTMNLQLDAFGDSDPGHYGSTLPSPAPAVDSHVRITSGTKVLLDSDNLFGDLSIPIVKARARYSYILDVDRYASATTLSTRTHTELGFTSAATDPDRAPAAVRCPECTTLPLVLGRVSYPVSPAGEVTQGKVPFTITPSFPQGRIPVGITSATLSLRPSGFDWLDVPVRADQDGRLMTTVKLEGFWAGTTVDVRLRLRDATGSTLDQTVERAFRLSSWTPPAARSARPDTGPFRRSVARSACASRPSGHAMRCLAQWRQGAGASLLSPTLHPTATTPPAGYGPKDIAAAYGLTGTGARRLVAVVDAFDNPRAEADLAVYRRANGLPACTTANGCFRKVDQRGGKAYPKGDPGWGVEIALDIQAVSAACPQCTILLVEADGPTAEQIGAATKTAARLGATVISHSYGTDEYNGSVADAARYYRLPGVAQVVSSGDDAFTTASFPAVAPGMISVGGTRMTKAGKAFRHSAWELAGSGCSAWFGKPTWQKDPNCEMRTSSDVSAVADPATGFAVYDTYGLGPDNGWLVAGGTSLSAPLVGGMIARAPTSPRQLWTGQWIYTHRAGFRDVVGGSNGSCGGDYLCTAVKGYDGPTGVGTPWGLSGL